MIPDRRQYALSKDQPILEQARRRKKGTTKDREALEVEFWAKFPLEKFCKYETFRPKRALSIQTGQCAA
jgi:hypothetical protein